MSAEARHEMNERDIVAALQSIAQSLEQIRMGDINYISTISTTLQKLAAALTPKQKSPPPPKRKPRKGKRK